MLKTFTYERELIDYVAATTVDIELAAVPVGQLHSVAPF